LKGFLSRAGSVPLRKFYPHSSPTQKPPNPQIRGLRVRLLLFRRRSLRPLCDAREKPSSLQPGHLGRPLRPRLDAKHREPEANHGIPNPRTGATGLARRGRICRRTECNLPSGWRIARQRGGSISPFTDGLGPLIAPSLEPALDCSARICTGEHGHDWGDPQFGQPIRVRGVVGRQIDREPGRGGGSNKGAGSR
jgi:hypothetical protein